MWSRSKHMEVRKAQPVRKKKKKKKYKGDNEIKRSLTHEGEKDGSWVLEKRKDKWKNWPNNPKKSR